MVRHVNPRSKGRNNKWKMKQTLGSAELMRESGGGEGIRGDGVTLRRRAHGKESSPLEAIHELG